MIRILLATTVILACTAASDAASRHRKHAHVKSVRAVTVPQQQIYPSRPAWAPASLCLTDEGYGRYLECGAGRSN